MGQDLSQASISLTQNADAYGGEGQNVIEVGFDELPLKTSFQSDLFDKSNEEVQKDLNLPSAEMVYDIITDYLTYSSTSTLSEAFSKVLIPLFCGTLDSKPKQIQILSNLFRFLRERAFPYFMNEGRRLNAINEQINGIQNDIVNTHRRIPEEFFNVGTYLKSEEAYQDFLTKFKEIVQYKEIRPHPSYAALTTRFSDFKSDDENAIYRLLSWGFGAGEITAIIKSLQYITNLCFENKIEKTNDFSFDQLKSVINSISLANTCFAPPTNQIISSTTISSSTQIGKVQTSFIASDGTHLYIIGKGKKLTIVDLSKNITKHENRFQQYTLDELNESSNEDMSITYSNGYLLIYSQKIPIYSIYRTKPFERVNSQIKFSIHGEFTIIPQCNPPYATDSKYFYSLNAPCGVAVLSIKPPNLVLHRFIDFVRSDAPLLEPFDEELFPSKFLSNLTAATNGITISFFHLVNSSDNQYTYFARHFSLVDGRHICDSQFVLEHVISTLTYDPWNRCYWGCNNQRIIHIPSFNSQPPWLTGSDINNVAEFSPSAPCSTHAEVLNSLINFLEFYTVHFAGLSFHAAQSNHNYSPTTARFFAPCTNDAVKYIINAINYFTEIYASKRECEGFKLERCKHTILSLIRLFDYNLSNMDTQISVIGDQAPPKFIYAVDSINILVGILENEDFTFAHKSVIFTIVNSIELLFTDNKQSLPTVFIKIIKKMSTEFILYTLQKIHNMSIYPYCFNSTTIKDTFLSLIKNYPKLTITETELLETYMRSLFINSRDYLLSQQQVDKGNKDILMDNFFTFSTMIFDEFSARIDKMPNTYNETTRSEIPNMNIFEKFIMLLHHFQQFPTVVDFATTKIHELFVKLTHMISTIKFDCPIYPQHNLLFYSVYSCYIDYIDSLMNNAALMKSSTTYSWLYQPTKESKLTPNDINDIVSQATTEQKSHRRLVRKGLSFNFHSTSYSNNAEIQEGFLTSLVAKDESQAIKTLIDYLYLKIPDHVKKVENNDLRHLERVILAAYTKQLGLTSDLCDLNIYLSSNQPVEISKYIKNIVQLVYKTRRYLRRAKQASSNTNESNNSYEQFIQLIMKKCIFLVHLQPCLRLMSDIESSFSLMAKKISSFMTSEITVEQYFDQIEKAHAARRSISQAVGYIQEILSNRFTPLSMAITSLMLEKYSTNDAIQTLVLGVANPMSKDIPSEVTETIKLINLVNEMTINIKEDFAQQSFIAFYTNVTFSVGQEYPSLIIEPTLKLIQYLTGKESKFNKENSTSLVSLLVSLFCVLAKNSESFATNEFKNLYQKLSQASSLDPDDPETIALFYRSGMDAKIHPSTIINRLMTCEPQEYTRYISALGELCQGSSSKDSIFYWILHEISRICSGGHSSFLKDYPSISEKSLEKENLCKTPDIILSGCLKLIQLVRRFLNESSTTGRYVMDVFRFILENFISPKEKVSSSLIIFSDQLLLYAVFGVLSNVIDVISFSSLIKDSESSILYYVSSINQQNKTFECWQLPINAESTLLSVPFSDSILSIPSTPFTPSIFPFYDQLIHVFIKFLTMNNPSHFTEGLLYYGLSSMHEYCRDLTFFNMLVNEKIYDVLPEFSFENYNSDFMNIVRKHLASNDGGFTTPRSSTSELFYASPSVIKDTDGLVFTDKQISCKDGLHVFISKVFSQTEDISLSIEAADIVQSYDAGFYHLAINESNIKCLMYSRRLNKSTISGKVKTALGPKESPKCNLLLKYDHLTKECSIYNNETGLLLQKHVFTSTMVCFVVVLYPGADLKYEFGVEKKILNTMDGKIVFKRNRKNINNVNCLTNAVQTITNIKDLNISCHPFSQPEDIECERFSGKNSNEKFMIFPADSVSSTQLVTSLEKSDKKNIEQKKLIKFPLNQILSTELLHFTTPPNSYYVLKNNCNDDPISTVFNPSKTFSVDQHTGKLSMKNRIKEFVPRDTLPHIHPHNFGILPSVILNHFATGYSQKLRKTLLSTVLLQCYSPSSIGIDRALVKFNFTDQNALLKSMLSLLTVIEPYDAFSSSPINFQLNLIDQNVMTPKSSQFLQKSAITNIFNYIGKHNKAVEFITAWASLLFNEGKDVTSHSVKQNHPYAIIVDPSSLPSPQTFTKQGFDLWIIMQTQLQPVVPDCICTISTNTCKGIKISNTIEVAAGHSFTLSPPENKDPGNLIAAIPMMKDDTVTLLGTFFDLVVSFKYFVIALDYFKKEIPFLLMQDFRTKVYIFFIQALLGNSPFFITYNSDILRFLINHFPLMESDIEGDLLIHLGLIGKFFDVAQHPQIAIWLEEIQTLWDEKFYLSLKYYFDYFASETDKISLKNIQIKPFEIPKNVSFDSFETNEKKEKGLFITLKRLLMPRDNQYGFPFYQLLGIWAKYSQKCPPTVSKRLSSKILKVEFIKTVPHSANFMLTTAPSSIKLQYSFEEDMSNPQELTLAHAFVLNNHTTIYIEICDDTNMWELLSPYFISNDRPNKDEFVLQNKEWFIDDIKHLLFNWDNNTDRLILATFPYKLFSNHSLQVDISPDSIASSTQTKPLNLLCVRAHFLLIMNWFFGNTKNDFMTNPSMKLLLPLVSPKLKLDNLRNIIKKNSKSRRPDINIDRISAVEVREGVSTNYNATLIAQMVNIYKNINDFKDSTDRPWEVHFTNEVGIDAGGPARELVTELALDICSPNCGLVIPTPNSRNEIGQYRDTVIPLPHPMIKNSPERYRVFGAVIAICIRTGLVQFFNFPPLVWEFLITGEIALERIMEIDDHYKTTIDSFKEAMKEGMTDEEFKARLNHKFVIQDARGNEMPLIQRGRTEFITASNCAQFISLANEFRINELKASLNAIRDGLWENIGIDPLLNLDWSTLEYAACGEREITYEALRKVTKFENLDNTQQDIFLKVCEMMTSEQRSLLLKFSTGRIRLPPNCGDDEKFLKVDRAEGIDRMPTSSTCFHQFHMPRYSSYQKAFKLITLAIEYTGSFELR
ncbi:hypothetical protein TVAG_121880 [Trichomonas vaginalis G3]|uniref:HECT domain-containing protein n=1 Tax=Trichomonas vaginalis (strain ATCC PRA-98 / G3) TaxID=412133 RepID=A2E999_TRIV3|nr:guanyl-nucleotide exchange factor protein [Trichomonas vaginalis G3]EAY10784.1 hypothetical protein TVAG_121880 [Trichomonas vaginalis G3]KAI5536076.1 guanyl-nucleotide exchange factor protein [Trichomonas vaginalis G3]|eukprot:XP_001323007.1 hypothetical protein [Trichomonas vaginalis G3]